MRTAMILAGGLMLIATSGAHAEEWCGYAARANAVIECGYTTVQDCASAVGKGGRCFADPELALDTQRAARPAPARHSL
jgi:hypothetical protein